MKQLKATLSLANREFSSDVTDFRVPNGIVFSLRLQGALETNSFSGLPLYEESAGCQTLTRQADRVALLETKLRVFENLASVLSKEMDSSRQKIATFRGQRGLDQDTIRGLELKVKMCLGQATGDGLNRPCAGDESGGLERLLAPLETPLLSPSHCNPRYHSPFCLFQIAGLQRCLAQKDVALSRLQERLQLSEQASFDGVFLWRIVDVHRKCYEAMCGKVCSLQSPGRG